MYKNKILFVRKYTLAGYNGTLWTIQTNSNDDMLIKKVIISD